MVYLQRFTSRAAAHLRSLRVHARAEDGFTIIEVIVSAAMVALMAGGIMAGLDATGRAASDLHQRSQADELAQQDQERMRGLSVLQLTDLDQTRTVTLDRTPFSVTSTGQFLSSTNGGSSCGSPKADYVKIVSTVDWASNRRPAVVEQSIISPGIGGTLLTRVSDDMPTGQAGVTVQAISGGDRFTATTDTSGCTAFAGTSLGAYYVIATKTGWVTPNGTSPAATLVSTTAADTRTVDLEYAEGGAAKAAFYAKVGATTVGGESPSLSWKGGTMLAPGTLTLPPVTLPPPAPAITTPRTLFPFHNGGTTANNYEMYGGRCTSDQLPRTGPNSAFISQVTVDPGADGTMPVGGQPVRLPALIVNTRYGTGTPPPRMVPSRIKLTDACGQAWNATVSSSANTSPTGALASPGQPYGTYQSVCAEYDPPGPTTLRHLSVTNVANTNFTSGRTLDIPMTSSSPSGVCP